MMRKAEIGLEQNEATAFDSERVSNAAIKQALSWQCELVVHGGAADVAS
jgi:hypothetical protein